MKYRVLGPVGFVNKEGQGETHSRPGAVVDVDEEVAKPLVATGKLVPIRESKSAESKPASKPKSES